MTDVQMMEELKKYDSPSVTNVVATYSGAPTCLSLYNAWYENWYTDASLRCWYPEIGPVVGYAVTCVFSVPDPLFKGGYGLMDVLEEMEKTDAPTIFVFEQKFPPEIANKVGLSGGNMTTQMKAMGCVGGLTNGPSRDIDEIRPMGFQYMTSGICAGHGAMQIQAIQVPVHIAGMDVAPGEIIHMDENGAVKFPADKLEAVLENLKKLHEEEGDKMSRAAKAKTVAELREIYSPQAAYGEKEKK